MAKTRRKHAYRKSKRWNPFRESWHVQQEIRGARPSKRAIRAARRAMARARRSGRGRKVVSSVLGMMNPRGRKRGGKAFTKHRKGRHWERAVHGSLPWFANPRRGRGRGRRGRSEGRRGGMKSAPSIRDWQGFKRIKSLMKNPRGHRGHRRKARHSHVHLVRAGGRYKAYEHRPQKRGKGRRGEWLR